MSDWENAKECVPDTDRDVLAVIISAEDGTRKICVTHCNLSRAGQSIDGSKWLNAAIWDCGDNKVLYWQELPEMPGTKNKRKPQKAEPDGMGSRMTTITKEYAGLIEDSMILRQLIRLMEREYDTAPYIMLNEKDVKLILGDRIWLDDEKKEA